MDKKIEKMLSKMIMSDFLDMDKIRESTCEIKINHKKGGEVTINLKGMAITQLISLIEAEKSVAKKLGLDDIELEALREMLGHKEVE